MTQDDITHVTLGHVDADLLDRLAQTGISQDLIDKGLEALEFFHAQDAVDQASRQMVMSASNPNALGRTIYGTCGNDVINGGEGGDTIYGGVGNDIIDGAEGNDTIYGGKGADSINGGEGNDTLYGGDGVDNFNPNGPEGTDTTVQEGTNEYDLCTEPIVAIDSTVVDENVGYANFAVRLNNVYDQAVTVTWKTVGGSATSTGDFTATSGGSLVIAAGNLSGTISVPINNDSLDETDETFDVEITEVTNAELGDGIATCTIIDNDTPTANMPTVSISLAGLDADGLVGEGDGGAPFTVTLSQAINKTVHVHYATTTSGTAIAGTHYNPVSYDLYFAPNQTSQQIGVEIYDDDMYEGNVSAPYFFVTLSNSYNSTIGTSSGYAIITDDDPIPTLSINDVTVTEGDPGGAAVNATFTLSLTNPINVPIAVALSIGPATALYSSDYSGPTTINVTIPTGQTSAQFSVPITADLVPEPQEFFYATITSSQVPTTDYQGTCTINDDDVDIDADIDRDGHVENDQDEADEDDIGTIVIANRANVYADPNEPARRREVILRTGDNDPVRVSRDNGNLKLYASQTGGTELFGLDDEITLSTGQSYWLQGGAFPSSGVRESHLSVRKNDNAAPYKDRIAVTVLWVDLSARIGKSDALTQSPFFDGFGDVSTKTGNTVLGVHRSTAGSTDGEIFTRGLTEIQGSISPTDATRVAFDTPLTSGFSTVGFANGDPATADFGFIFRRTVSFDVYKNGQSPAISSGTKNDDSYRVFQDVDPDLNGPSLVIIDHDGPATRMDGVNFAHLRDDFDEHVVFNFYPTTPERLSANLEWAVTLDTALDYNNKAVTVLDLPNNQAGANEVFKDTHLSSRTLGIAVAAPMSAMTAANNKNIPRGVNVDVTITGTNLIGDVYLKKGGTLIQADIVRVLETDAVNHFSNLTEIRATFNTTVPVDTGYELFIRNAAGDSQAIPGFSIVA